MRDYAELIKALRHCAGDDGDCDTCPFSENAKACSYERMMSEAADAIEELMPKRGKWMTTDAFPHRIYCSVCYKTYLANADWKFWADGCIPRNYCPNCGANMESEVDE